MIEVLKYLFRWTIICIIIALPIGAASSFFLHTLNWVTDIREKNIWIIIFLPIAGYIISYAYEKYGKNFSTGNNLIIDTIHNPYQPRIPFLKALMIYLTTIVTHLFGGSAGREGTAVQMAGSIADQFTCIFKLVGEDRKALLIASVAAGFGSVFGTPAAGTLFAIEFLRRGKISFQYIIPSLMGGYFAHYTGHLLYAPHTHYTINSEMVYTIQNFFYVVVCGVIFGLMAKLFTEAIHSINIYSQKILRFNTIRTLVGGFLVLGLLFIVKDSKYLGLGIPVIQSAFTENLSPSVFFLKTLFTIITLGFGFKGGEVTPLFFIGATLGNAVQPYTPLPLDVMAGLGFVGVFAGATNTPVACTLMAMELFGWECGIFTAVACTVSYWVSGRGSIYTSQL